MGTGVPLTAIDVAAAPSSRAETILSTFDLAGLRRDFERLSVDDLTALASFPVEPHDLIGRVVAVTHCLLLSLAPGHTTLELLAPPWPLLRLQLLENTTKVWRKLRKRAWQLETGARTLSPVQIRFGCKELVPFILPPKDQNVRYHGAWQLERLAQVSTIAASLGAWVVFCLCCSVLSTSLHVHVAPNPEFPEDGVAAQPLSSIKIPPRRHTPRKRAAKNSLKLEPVVARTRCLRSSRRIGIKTGGRFLLCHIRFPVHSSSRVDVDSVHTLGEWSVYCLEANRIGRQLQGPYSMHVSWWKPPQAIELVPSRVAHPLALSYLPLLAQLSLLLQLGIHERIFERPVHVIPHARAPRAVPSVFTLKFDVVVADSHAQLALRGIGNVWITMETTVADLRSQVTPFIASRLVNFGDKQLHFQFMYRGSFLAVSQETQLAAVALLPFATFVVTSNYPVKEFRKENRASQLWRHHCQVAQALVNAGLPDRAPYAQSLLIPGLSATIPTLPQVYAMRQTLTDSAAGTSSTSGIIEVFTHWQAFVHFQELQDSSILFQLPQRSPKKQTRSPHESPKHKDQEEIRDENVPYGPQPQPLPRKKFNSKKEWLLPLYAVVDVVSPTAAVLKTPFRQDVEHAFGSPCRLVLAEEANIIHFARVNCVTTERDSVGVLLAVFDITFVRDESCSAEALVPLKSAYVWLIVPRNPHRNRQVPALPTQWMLDLHRFVQHSTYEFQSPTCPQANHFRVCVSWAFAERAIEAAFWSKDVDWASSVSSTDVYSTVLRQIFDALCRSHPPAVGMDSVKFSKLLYEASIQPKLLGIGDAAFLFASNLTPGFTYEMDFDGFVRALEWLAQQFYGATGSKGKPSPCKTAPGIQHAMLQWQLTRPAECGARDHLLASLRRFCFETLVYLPSLTLTWHEIMDSWRLASKQQLLQEYALTYCAATRLRASWIGFVTWRVFFQRRQRMKQERLAATKLQSLARRRRLYLEYQRVRRLVIRTQLRIHARSELRRLRAERAAFIERTRLRLVKWMRYHLWRLRQWKRLNAEKVARRGRIRDKRLRRLGVAVFPLDTWRLRFSLYKVEDPVALEIVGAGIETVSKNVEQQGACHEAYELEVVDSTRSWGSVFCVSQQQLDQFITEEMERHALQLQLGLAAVTLPTEEQVPNSEATRMVLNKVPGGGTLMKTAIVRDSVAYPVLKPNAMLLALARRLFIQKRVQRGPMRLCCYADPADTSLGKLVFTGAIRTEVAQGNGHGELIVEVHVVRVLEWAGTFKFLMYTPATSARRRYDLDAPFVLSVLQFSRFQSMRLTIPEGEEDAALAADREELSKASVLKVPAGEALQFIHHRIRRVLNGPHKLLALQCILSYVLRYGVRTPTYSMMPHVVAERGRQREEHEMKQRSAMLNRERQLIVKVQARLRQHLAHENRLQLALASYSKEFDRESGRFVYVLQYPSGKRTVLGERKPFSLFDQDVPLPPDEWQLVSAGNATPRFFNPRRGVYSRLNDLLAAPVIQRWYRGKMWNGINNWSLRDLGKALRYHNGVQKPTNMTDHGQLENMKRYALQLHVLEHQYKAAYSVYEAALKISPDDPQTLACLATLLVISCRYPAIQSWQRAMALLHRVRDLVGHEIISTLHDVEQNFFRWALFLQPKNPHVIANYAVYLQCVHLDIDKADLLYRRALDLDPANDLIITNFQRLQSERAPGRTYAFAGPGTIAVAYSSVIRRCGSELQWREMEDPTALPPMPKRFFHNPRTGECTWDLPAEDQSLEVLPDSKENIAR
ncbi:hypothetical protein PHYPSEUDO_009569 [Phytophthora pseudosyringae]|uniref:WW domain-containing protein n=1 Tax=Phytophthora pseudosyringae TaxID=221518 RepID=A0A8T1WJF3_9STRA|nr:hypothetical protein PHYPSEUDO_009569 [Phytophthora pseudosyringae]